MSSYNLNTEYTGKIGSDGMVYVDVSDVVSGLYRFANFTRGAARKAAKETAVVLEDKMFLEAPWKDRTGEARRGLKAEYFEEDYDGKNMTVGVKLKHSVSYGTYLEFNGTRTISYLSRQRPILVPTMESKEATVLLTKLQEQFAKIAKV